MFARGKLTRARGGAALAACALAALALAGCSSGGSGATAQPSWAADLGPGVTVIPPGTASPGNGSPQEVMSGVVASITKGPISDFCKYEEPSQQSECSSTFSQLTTAQVASQLPTFKNYSLGYTAIDGDKALIGVTGTICVPDQIPQCFTNTDPAAIFDSGKTFEQLWSESADAPANAYSLSPAIKVNGSWYAYTVS